MSDPIIIRIKLDTSDANRAAQQIARATSNALDAGVSAARQHANRLEQIARLNAAQLQVIENRKQAQLEVIRARAADRAVEHERKIQRESQRSANALDLTRATVGKLSGAFAALAGVGAVALFERVGRAALDAAIDLDKQVNTLKALTGSAEAAQKRFQELFKLAQQTPGLTTNLALTLDAQLRILNTTEQTINRILPVIGRLNAISPLGDPRQFASNLGQLITQNFERQDLKELVGQSPLAGELIKQVFGVNNPTNAAAIRASARKLGIDTADELFTAMAKAAENHPALKNVTESLGTQFEKLRDRLNIALAPVGKELASSLIPIFDDLVKSVERYGGTAAQVFRDNRSEIVGTVREVGGLAIELGKLAGAIFNLAPGGKTGLGALRQEFEDLQSIAALAADIAEGNIFARPRTVEVEAARRRADFAQDNIRGPMSRDALLARIRREQERLNGGGGNNRGGGAAGDPSDRQRQLTELQKAVKDVDQLTKQVAALEAGTGKLFEQELKLFQKEFERTQLEERRKQLGFIRAKIARGESFAPQLPGGIGLPTLPLTAAGAPAGLAGPGLRPDSTAGEAARLRFEELQQRLRIEEVKIQNQLNAGLLSGADAHRQLNAARAASRDELIKLLEAQRQAVGVNSLEGLRIAEQIEQTRLLGVELSNTERFMRGFGSQIETVGDAFERLGQNVSRALLNTKDLLNSLKQAVLGFFNDLLGQSLQNLLRSVFAPIAGALGGGAIGGGGIGGLFRTPSTFPAQIAQAFAGAGGSGITAPPSISQSIFGGLGGIFSGGGGSRAATSAIDEFFGAGVPRTAGRIGGGFSLSGILGSLASSSPLLGLSLGSSLGGQSVAGQILGAIGGGAVGLGLSFGASVFSAAGGGLGALGPAALAALGPIALIGAPLIVGAILLGKAAQRRKDEEASGQFLTQALQAIEQLKAGIAGDQIEGSQAKAIFDSQILGTFIQRINELKTESVRKSRLTNQVADLRKVYNDLIPPEITAQEKRRADTARFAAIDRRLIPQFASGGVVPGIDRGFDSVRALLTPGEMVLTLAQQSNIARMAGADIFRAAGVPGVQPQATFQTGGIAPVGSSSRSDEPIVVFVDVQVGMSQSGAEQIAVRGMSGSNGRQVVVKHVEAAALDGGGLLGRLSRLLKRFGG